MTQARVDPDVREQRAALTAEVFHHKLVNQMLRALAKYGPESWKRGKTFCDLACGNGNMLVWALLKKISRGHNPLEALKTIYGAETQRDNVRECRLRLLKIISIFESVTEQHIEHVLRYIVWIDIKKHPLGSLEYDFSFKRKPNKVDIERWMTYVHKDGMLDDVELPVNEEKFQKPGNYDMFADDEE